MIATFLFCNLSYTQKYPTEPDKFFKEIYKGLKGYKKEFADDFELKFESVWMSENFPESYRKTIYKTVNKMDENRMQLYPEIHDYLASVFGFVKNNKPEDKFEKWHSTLEKMMDSRDKRKFKEFLSICGDYFSKNIIYNGPTMQWEARGGDYNFVFEKKPYMHFTDITLVGFSRGDSTVIKNTTGVYDMLTNKWEGSGGIVNWQRADIPPEDTYAELTNYKMSLKSPYYGCDTVILHTTYFDEPLSGKLTENITPRTASGVVEYPQFISFDNSLKIKEIVPKVDYIGGFMLKGGDFRGSSSGENPAQLVFKRGELPFVRLKAENFTITEKQILTDKAEATVYIGEEDSIYHPGVQVVYQKSDDEIQLLRGKEGVSVTAFFNSYHQLDMYCSRLIWKRGNSEILLTYIENSMQRDAKFESKNYYSRRVYDQLMGMGGTHPLVAIHNHVYKYDRQVETEGKLASAMGYTVSQVKPLLLQLTGQGFISYDTEKGMITPLPKLSNFIKNRTGKLDYDALVFNSDLNQQNAPKSETGERDENYYKKVKDVNEENLKKQSLSNALIDLGNLDMIINGLDRVVISENKNVEVYPSDKKVTVKKNRDFLFKGWLNSGKVEILLNEGSFSYEKFKIYLMDTELARLRVKPIFGKSKKPVRMFSHIKGLDGYIEIDDTLNKAGIDTSKMHFPILHATKDSYVFYDHESIYKGAYDSSRFYFELEPFVFDSLNGFEESEVAFKGKLHSAGIFPIFAEKLRIQEDYSFGFKRMAPEKGYDFYGTGANYSNEIRLSNQGLQGSGTINYITSTAVSNNFTFLPDSTVGIAQTYENTLQEKPTEYPDVVGEDVYITYVPKGQIMKAKSVKKPLYFFNKEASLNGELKVQPKGMTGRGYMYFQNAELASKKFEYGSDFIDSDTAAFNLQTLDSDDLAFVTDNVNAHVSFSDRKGEFVSNGEETYVEFPEVQYICYMDKFNWYMDNDDIELEKEDKEGISIDTDLDLAGSNFYSIHPDQDSLNFMAPKALFSLKSKTVTCKEVDYIDIADARIYPDSGLVVVRKKAKMDPLENSEIVANYVTKFHKIVNATTKITARRAYTAEGDYPFKDANDDEFIIKFKEIYLDTTFQTRGKGVVAEDDDFRFSPEFEFYGDVQMIASEQLLSFNGATRISHSCDAFTKNWMSFEASIDPKDIYIPVSKDMKDLDKNPIAAGIVLNDNRDSLGVYPAFLSMKSNKENADVISADGWLHYNEGTKEFQIASRDKLDERSNPGNFISLHTESCTMQGEGDISFGMDLGPLSFDPVGYVNYNTNNGKTSFRWAGKLNFFFDAKLLETMAEKINEIPDLKTVDINMGPYEQSIVSNVDQKTADKIKSDINVKGGLKKVEKEMNVPFYFADVKMKAVNSEGRFYFMSEGDLGISNIFDEPLLKNVPGNLIIEFDPVSGSTVHLNIELPGGNYYYFYYKYDGDKKGDMQVFTSDKSFKESITSMKDDQRKDKNFKFDVGTNSVYLSRFRNLIGE